MLFHLFCRGEFFYLKFVLVQDYFCDSLHLFRQSFGNGDAEFYPVSVLAIAHFIHVLRIVWVIVDGSHGAHLVKALHEHTLVIHVREAHGAYHVGHSAVTCPLLGGIEERAAHFWVIDKVYEAEPGFLPSGFSVEHPVDYCGDAPYWLSVAVCHEGLSLAEVECRVLFGQQGVDIIEYQRRHKVRVSFVEVNPELYVTCEFFFCGWNGANCDGHISILNSCGI